MYDSNFTGYINSKTMRTELHNAPAMVYQSVGRQSEIQGASPHKLIELLLAGAIKHISIAEIAIENDDIELRGTSINRSIDIISELRNSLNLEKGGEISGNLDRLYVYIEQTLINAHLNKDKQSLDIASELVTDLLKTWKEIKVHSLAD